MSPIDRNPENLFPPFRRRLEAFMRRWNAENPEHRVVLFEGLRTFERQQEYYDMGRINPGRKITNAMPGFSWHQYGVAADLVFDDDPVRPGPQWTWDGRLPWPQLGAMGHKEFGLSWAGLWKSFPEFPHFEMRFGLELVEVRELHEQGGLAAVWAEMEMFVQRKKFTRPGGDSNWVEVSTDGRI